AVINCVGISGSSNEWRMVGATADRLVVNARAERSGACYPGASIIVRIGDLARGRRRTQFRREDATCLPIGKADRIGINYHRCRRGPVDPGGSWSAGGTSVIKRNKERFEVRLKIRHTGHIVWRS